MPKYRLHYTTRALIHGYVVIEADHLTAAKSFGFSAVRRFGLDPDYLGGAEIEWQPDANEVDDIQFEDAERYVEPEPAVEDALDALKRMHGTSIPAGDAADPRYGPPKDTTEGTTVESPLRAVAVVESGTDGITENDCFLLDEDECPHAYWRHIDRAGALLYVAADDAEQAAEKERALIDFGFSGAFLTIYRQAVAQGATYLMFDRDA